MTDHRSELLQGTLDLLVLRVLSLEPMHGWGIGERIGLLSGEVFLVKQGSLYPALQRMRRKGWIRDDRGQHSLEHRFSPRRIPPPPREAGGAAARHA